MGVLLITQLTHAQGIIYVSSMNQTPTGSESVGSDSWYATLFRTGNNANGYELNSIQLAMANATGSPSGFTVAVYSSVSGAAVFPGNSLGMLDGSLSPVNGGNYTYTDDSGIILLPHTDYYIVLTATTAAADGDAYDWSVTSTYSPVSIGGWGGDNILANSSNGSSWRFIAGAYPLFAINAIAIPEPSSSWLLLLGGGFFLYVRGRKPRAATTAHN